MRVTGSMRRRIAELLGSVVGTIVLMGAGVADASPATAHCCLTAAKAISGPVPAGDVRFGTTMFPRLVVRQASGALSVWTFAAGAQLTAVAPTGATWPYRTLWLGDVDGDGNGQDELLGRDGTRIVVAKAAPEAIAPATPMASLPRSFTVVRLADVDDDDADELVALDPKTGRIRFVDFSTGGRAVTSSGGQWPRGYSFQLADVDGDGAADAVGVDARGRVHLGLGNGHAFVRHGAVGPIPPHATMRLAEATGDRLADLIYRPAGSDDVYVRQAFTTSTREGFQAAHRWGCWNHRLALTPAFAGLAARDPDTGRIVQGQFTRHSSG